VILAIRTDKPDSELYLINENDEIVAKENWQAHRQLADTLHTKIDSLLSQANVDYSNVTGIIAYSGPGSFTGLRIGITVANSIADSYKAAITGATGDDWIKDGLGALKSNPSKHVSPVYGSTPHITQPRK
jgi:tRNA threonylcarbamoyladenosine biosynthesis protein TsaB